MDTKERIGVFIETGDPQVAEALMQKDLDHVFPKDGDVVVFRGESWTDSDASARIRRLCDTEQIGQAVVCGPSAGSGLIPEWIDGEGARAAIPLSAAAVREQCAWAEKDPATRAAKAQRIVEMAVARARGAEPLEFSTVESDRTVAVIGGNHAAFQMAAVLLDAGFPVTLLQTEAPAGCFYPLPEELVQGVKSHPNLRHVESVEIDSLQGLVGDFRIGVRRAGEHTAHTAGAMIVAVDAQTRPLELGAELGKSDLVISLREYGQAVSKGKLDGKSACIWLDRDGLDRRCAGQAALSFALEHARRGGRPVLLYQQIPVYGLLGQVLYDEARAAGVTVIRYDDQNPRIELVADSLRVTITDTVLADRVLSLQADLLVAPAPVTPSATHAWLASLLRQPLDLDGFLQPGNVRHRPVSSARRGVYFVGGCHDECDPAQAALEAQAVLAELQAALPAGGISVRSQKIVIDADKCAACLTCYRECPHGAIRPNQAQHRMDFLDAACWQCGICTAVCPGSALEYSGLRRTQMNATLEVAAREIVGHAPIIAFACRQSAVPAADAAGTEGLGLPTEVLFVDVPCAGMVSDQMILDALEQGARGVIVIGCHHDNCRSLWGSDLARKRLERVAAALETIGAGSERIRFHSLAANEPRRLVNILRQAAQEMPAGRIGD
ncbi:MAG TPA: hydrogenase iron-sulfur subunit [Myxococcota bacterium]|nr:hydrogenase iron-sulfur subunit [Myxococcota bacterium]